ncbi:tolB protein precursor [Minicystis rosea]|nr:tolB protein precursor [Minicystis rosea]
MRLRAVSNLALVVTLAASIVAACSSSGETGSTGTTSGGGVDAGGGGAPATLKLRIEPDIASASVTLGSTPGSVTFTAFASTTNDGIEQDVTADVDWITAAKIATISGGVAKLTGNGGKTTVTATYKGVNATAALTVQVKGDVFLPGTDATTKSGFDAATADPDPTAAPALEYPEDGVVLPGNLPPIEAQWSQVADNGIYRVRVSSPEILDVAFYTPARELSFPADAWAVIGQTTADTPTSVTVEGLGGGKIRASAPRAMTIASDAIDDSAIYVWQSSTGSFRVLDIIKGTDVPLPNDNPVLSPGQPCSGCHRISRDGKRFAYTYNGGNFEFGTLVYDEKKGLYASKIAPNPGFRATYATFNPKEDSQVPAMLLTVPDNVPQNTPGTVRLQVIDPDTGTQLPSNLAEQIAAIDPAVGHATSMPDWSPDGTFVVFAAYDSDKNYVRLLGDDIVASSIVEMPVSWDKDKGFTFGTPKTLVQAPAEAAMNPDVGQNNLLPTISPDGTAVAFTRAAGWWSIKTQVSQLNLSGQIAVVRRKDNQVLELVKGSNGGGTTLSSTWPQWAPSAGKRYAWLAYAAERPYGHRLTLASPENAQCGFVQGQKMCKHLWVTAIDLQKLGSGTEDPSAAPFFIPGQTIAAQYVSPQWTKAIIKPPQ